jgi:hypothetical protein
LTIGQFPGSDTSELRPPEWRSLFLPPMPDAVSFNVTQSAQWFMRDDERIEYPWEGYGGLTLPYPELWMELQSPNQLRTGQGMMSTPK